MDLEEQIIDQIQWSEKTFGPGDRTNGLIAHICEELAEIEADPSDVTEWIDVIILAIDGAWRSGHSAKEICAALHEKHERNKERKWPDWREFTDGQPINHVRDEGGEA